MPRLAPAPGEKLPDRFRQWIENSLRRAIIDMPTFTNGTGSPEGVKTGAIGDQFTRTDGTSTTTLYIKTTAGGNTGWIAIG